MSVVIKGNKITLTRGDTLKVLVGITNGGEPYVPEQGDFVRFALKKFVTDDEPILIKSIPIDTMILELIPADTKNLEFGRYVYDIELTTSEGDVDTFIGPETFDITEEVY